MNKKRALVNLYKDIVLVTSVRIFSTALFTNNNIKVVIQIDAFLAHLWTVVLDAGCRSLACKRMQELESFEHLKKVKFKSPRFIQQNSEILAIF
jgi:hypothetical protein